MRIKYEFSVREIAGDYVLVPLGEAAIKLSGMITTNDVGVFIVEQLQTDISKQELLEKVLDEFEIDSKHASDDIDEFISHLNRLDLLEGCE
ncbi:MAG: PqqD family protein [Blautia sp.]